MRNEEVNRMGQMRMKLMEIRSRRVGDEKEDWVYGAAVGLRMRKRTGDEDQDKVYGVVGLGMRTRKRGMRLKWGIDIDGSKEDKEEDGV